MVIFRSFGGSQYFAVTTPTFTAISGNIFDCKVPCTIFLPTTTPSQAREIFIITGGNLVTLVTTSPNIIFEDENGNVVAPPVNYQVTTPIVNLLVGINFYSILSAPGGGGGGGNVFNNILVNNISKNTANSVNLEGITFNDGVATFPVGGLQLESSPSTTVTVVPPVGSSGVVTFPTAVYVGGNTSVLGSIWTTSVAISVEGSLDVVVTDGVNPLTPQSVIVNVDGGVYKNLQFSEGSITADIFTISPNGLVNVALVDTLIPSPVGTVVNVLAIC